MLLYSAWFESIFVSVLLCIIFYILRGLPIGRVDGRRDFMDWPRYLSNGT